MSLTGEKMNNKELTEKVGEVMRTTLQEHPEMVLRDNDALNKVQERMVRELCSELLKS